MRWNLISADGVKLPFHQQGNQVSFKWKSSWNLFIPKFAANIPEEMLPSKRQWYWERGPISDVIVIRYSRNFPHPHFCYNTQLSSSGKYEKRSFQLMFWIQFPGLVTIQEHASHPDSTALALPRQTQQWGWKTSSMFSHPASPSWRLIAMSCSRSQAV